MSGKASRKKTMRHPNEAARKRRSGPLRACLLALFVFFACAGGEGPTGGETHFLVWCAQGPAGCGDGFTCVCGVCTRECALRSECQNFPGAECTTSASELCGDAPSGRCDVACRVDADCSGVSSSHSCQRGYCRAGAMPASNGGASNGGAGGAGGASNGGAPDNCEHGTVDGNSVLVIGDSFMAQSHAITAELEQRARASGALASAQRYQDQSSLLDNALALNGHGIQAQYTRAQSEAPIRVVIMTGGGADLLLGTCDPPVEDCALIANAVAAAEDLFAQMAQDGVSHVVYVFYPNPVDAKLAQKVDALRPLAQRACEQSAVPCHFVDLRPSFEGHYSEYILSDGINPTTAGAQAAADTIWATMQLECIAQ